MRRDRVGDSSGKGSLFQPVATLFPGEAGSRGGRPEVAAWRGHLVELAFVCAVWGLALAQVGLVVARGGAWTPDSSLAMAFALACPLVLLEFRRSKGISD